jgi:hypothetical protein
VAVLLVVAGAASVGATGGPTAFAADTGPATLPTDGGISLTPTIPSSNPATNPTVNLGSTGETSSAPTGTSDSSGQSSETPAGRYGPFGLFDGRSEYGTGFFPEPFLVDEGDLDKEIVFSWLHQEGKGNVTDVVSGEVEWSFGLATIEVEVPWERDTFQDFDPVTGRSQTDRTEGMDSIQVTVRHPVWQYVNDAETVDNTVVVACEIAMPTNSEVGHDAEVVPEVFDLLRLGDHFGFQTHIGYSTLYGVDTPNHQTLEYSADFSYSLDNSNARVPDGVLAVLPIVELAGYRGLNTHDLSDQLTGLIGFRVNLDSIGPLSPRLGIGYIVPIDKQDRRNFSWGVETSLVFDL